MLLDSFFSQPAYRNEALECLAEIGTLSDLEPQYDTLFQSMYIKFMARLGEIFSPETNLAASYLEGSDEDNIFVQRLALFFCGFFKAHLNVLETPQHSNLLLQGLFYLVRISEVPDNEVFKICLEYWHILTADLYESECKLALTPANPLSLGNGGSRKHQYAVILTGVRQVMISRMAKPEEVLVVEDENGDVVRETTKDTEQLAQYKTMKECLV
ncbi:hypothetical protein TeGR_g2247, partial [Tetraparma gracilis]